MDKSTAAPCDHLEFLFDYEVQHGNHVADVKELPGHVRTYFANTLKIWGTPATAKADSRVVEYWDSLDELGLTVEESELMENPPPIFSGWRCKVHGHILAGP